MTSNAELNLLQLWNATVRCYRDYLNQTNNKEAEKMFKIYINLSNEWMDRNENMNIVPPALVAIGE